jgi:predicted CXXCH cytochrome family protein
MEKLFCLPGRFGQTERPSYEEDDLGQIARVAEYGGLAMSSRTLAFPRLPESLLAVSVLALWCALGVSPGFGQKMPASLHTLSVASQTWATAPASAYAGPETCSACHQSEYTEFEKTVHAGITFPGKPYIKGCEMCHGPGKAHADAMLAAHGDKQKIVAATKLIFSFHGSPKENAERCLTCHITSGSQQEFAHSIHALNGISCNQCHSPHLVEAANHPSETGLPRAQAALFEVPQLPQEVRWLHNGLLKESQPDLCYGCHATIEAQFALPVHHRVPEGLMKCTDCHNPHGTNNPAMLVKTNWETCVSCHVEKRGPFVYEHPIVRVDGCIACHNPHGSVNRMLLVRREGRMLCLECHNGFHNQSQVPHSRLGFQTAGECTRCHVAIHGSNFDPNFLR